MKPIASPRSRFSERAYAERGPTRPKLDGARRHSECGLARETDTGATRSGILPREKSQDCAGTADLVTVIKVISTVIVEVHRPLDEAKS
jgi:hypothetical protein